MTQDNIAFNQINSPKGAKPGVVNIINCWDDQVNITLGAASDLGGKYATLMLDRACDDLRNDQIQALVTAPINKKSMELSGFKFAGHTEYFDRPI